MAELLLKLRLRPRRPGALAASSAAWPSLMRSVNVVVTGAEGFIGRNLVVCAGAARRTSRSWRSTSETPPGGTGSGAGARPTSSFTWPASTGRRTEAEFGTGNAGFTRGALRRAAGSRRRRARSCSRSSIQAELDNPYGAQQARRPRRRWQRYRGDRAAPAVDLPPARTCSASGAGRTTTRSSPPSATTSPAACRSRSPIPARALRPGLRRRRGRGVRRASWTQRRRGCCAPRRAARPITMTLGELAELHPVVPRDARTPARARLSATTSSRKLYGDLPVVPAEPTSFAYALEQRCDARGVPGGVRQVARVRADLRLAHAAGHHARQPLPPHEDREVPRARRARPSIRLPAHRSAARCIEYPRARRGLPGGRHPAGVHALASRTSGSGEMVTLFWAERGLRPGAARHRTPSRCCEGGAR